MPTKEDEDPKQRYRLPKAAHFYLLHAKEIAYDQMKLKNAYDFWKKAFEDIEGKKNIFSEISIDKYNNIQGGLVEIENKQGFPNTPAFNIAAAIPDFEFLKPDTKNKKLKELIERHNSILIENKSSGKFVLKTSGVLVSAAEIAKFLKARSFIDVKKDILAFKKAAENPTKYTNKTQVERGIRAIREVYDLTRRFIYCQESRVAYIDTRNGNSTQLFSELLALYRQETGLMIAPPAESFQHSPLIQTKDDTGRDPRVTFQSESGSIKNVERPGFNLVYETGALIKESAEARAGAMLGIDLIVTGGLDSMTKPRLSDRDELVQLVHQALGVNGESKSAIKIIAALLMAEMEWRDNLPTIDTLVTEVINTSNKLVAIHQTEFNQPDVCLVDKEGSTTQECLKIAFKWYASRMKPATLIPYPQRKDFINLPRFSPFVTYLRYHLMDIFFLVTLANCIIRIKELSLSSFCSPPKSQTSLAVALAKSKWKPDAVKTLRDLMGKYDTAISNRNQKRIEYHKLLLARLKSGHLDPRLEKLLKPTTVEIIKNELTGGKGIRQRMVQVVENELDELRKKHYLWQYSGFIKYLKEKGDAPSWLKVETRRPNLGILSFDSMESKIAVAEEKDVNAETEVTLILSQIALEVVKIIRDLKIMEAVCIALEWSTYDGLDKWKIPIHITDPRQPYMKAHSFERVRTVYEMSLIEAKVDPNSLRRI